jgi:hypothetical protein
MISLAHVINPVVVDHTSDLIAAQPITFETMRVAKEFSKNRVDVDLCAVQFYDEPRVPLPGEFIKLPDLTRSIADIKAFKRKRELALIKDILDALSKSSLAEYFIYTNVDIALQPYFYLSIAKIIEKGTDAFVINRRTIPGRYGDIERIPFMYAEVGEPHPGYDCFVFRRDMYPKFKLGTICIGTPWIGRALLANMVTYSNQFKEFRKEHLTFHIGDSLEWRKDEYRDYFQNNRNEYLRIFRLLEEEKGGFQPVWHSYLLETGRNRQFPEFELWKTE